MKSVVIIPAYNEERAISQVIQAIPLDAVHRVIVVDNDSNDHTAQMAHQAGAEVFFEPQKGYGSACLRGIVEADDAEILIFLDADFSDDPAYIRELIQPILDDWADLVIGSRALGRREPGALPLHARIGNSIACFLIDRLFGVRFSDLGPFRAIHKKALERLKMQDKDYGWTVEMQTKAAILRLRCLEVPVPYRKRIGRSKISGTVTGSLQAGTKILWTIYRLWLNRDTLYKEDMGR